MNSVRPIGTRRRQGTRGRASTSAGAAAMRKRSAVSWGGEKSSSAQRVATKARPQMTTTASTSASMRERHDARP